MTALRIAIIALAFSAVTAPAHAASYGSSAEAASLVSPEWSSALGTWISVNQIEAISVSRDRISCRRSSSKRFSCRTSAHLKDSLTLRKDRHYDCRGHYDVVYRTTGSGPIRSVNPDTVYRSFRCA